MSKFSITEGTGYPGSRLIFILLAQQHTVAAVKRKNLRLNKIAAFKNYMANLYLSAAKGISKIKGQAIHIGERMDNSFSLLELFSFLIKKLSIKMNFQHLFPRISDQKIFVADIGKAMEILGWIVNFSKEEGVRRMTEWVKSNA